MRISSVHEITTHAGEDGREYSVESKWTDGIECNYYADMRDVESGEMVAYECGSSHQASRRNAIRFARSNGYRQIGGEK